MTLKSRKYVRTRRKIQEVAIYCEPLLEPVEKTVIPISDRLVIRLHQVREDFEKISTAIDDCIDRIIKDLEKGKSLNFNTIITFMQKQILLIDNLLNRTPEKYSDLKNSIMAFHAKTQAAITDLETLAAESTQTHAVSSTRLLLNP